jgi:hypothetical protein
MILKKAMLLGAILALGSTPAWALPGGKHTGQGGPAAPARTSNPKGAHGAPHGSEPGQKGSEHGKGGKPGGSGRSNSHRCVAHSIAYVASGTLVSDTLLEGADHTYSGEVVLEVQHGNRHSRAALRTKKTYAVEDVHLTLAVPDLDKDGVVGVDDLVPGDRVRLIGHVTTLLKGCAASEFTPKLTIRKVVFHAPTTPATTTTTTSSSTSTSSTDSTTTSTS